MNFLILKAVVLIVGLLICPTVTVSVKAGTAGRLFGSVTDKDIAAAIKAAAGVDIDRHSIKTAGHIKKAGDHAVKVTLAHSVVASVTVKVVAVK